MARQKRPTSITIHSDPDLEVWFEDGPEPKTFKICASSSNGMGGHGGGLTKALITQTELIRVLDWMSRR